MSKEKKINEAIFEFLTNNYGKYPSGIIMHPRYAIELFCTLPYKFTNGTQFAGLKFKEIPIFRTSYIDVTEIIIF
jgi:hypothetical protein